MKLKSITGIVLMLAFFLVACEDKIPINEFTKAKEAIDLASSVKADQYSPEEFKESNDQLVKAHDVLIKDDKLDDSIKNSEQSYVKAMEAYNKSAVLYAADALKRADEAISEADTVYAERLSPDLYAESRELYTSANEKFENKDYMASYALSDESYKKAVKAKEESLDNKYQLQVKIDEVHSILSKVEQYDYEEYAAENYNIATAKTEEAENSYKSDALRDGFESIETARINADAAYKQTMEGVTFVKITQAEDVVNEAENSNGADAAEEDLAAAKEALNNAKMRKSSGSYEESITYANEAIRLGNSVIEAGDKASIATVKSGDTDGSDADVAAVETDKTKTKTKSGFVSEDEDFFYYKVKTWEKYEDCLSRIAEQYYKNAKAWKRIYNANKNIIKNPDLIRPGWIIKVPKIKK
jgi:nucleoid-associated protein YgaU